MIPVSREALIVALKRFKAEAKQDLLACTLTENPEYWRTHAEARRTVYKKLLEKVESDGVESAYQAALCRYCELTGSPPGHPELQGEIRAIEILFGVIGITRGDLAELSLGAGDCPPKWHTALPAMEMVPFYG